MAKEPEPCKTCGTCPTCGRSPAQVVFIQPPQPIYIKPYQPTTCSPYFSGIRLMNSSSGNAGVN